MKKIFIFAALFFTMAAEAQWVRPGQPPPYPGRPPAPYPGNPGRPPAQPPYGGGITCQANDEGWEEHRGGHRSCRECLAVHGQCVETCTRNYESHQCRFDGYDPRMGARSFTGFGNTRYQAEDDALYQCRRAGYYDCRYVNCTVSTDRQVVSERMCR